MLILVSQYNGLNNEYVDKLTPLNKSIRYLSQINNLAGDNPSL